MLLLSLAVFSTTTWWEANLSPLQVCGLESQNGQPQCCSLETRHCSCGFISSGYDWNGMEHGGLMITKLRCFCMIFEESEKARTAGESEAFGRTSLAG